MVKWNLQGFTLIELLVVLAVVGILLGLAGWGSRTTLQRWQSWRGAQQLADDLREAQARAERGGGYALSQGALVTARSFLVFEAAERRYALFDWRDSDGDGRPGEGESLRVWTRELPAHVDFGWGAGVARKACGNSAGSPTVAVTFGSASYPPCSGRPCIKFDRQGFSSMGPGAIYLRDGAQSFAVSGTRAGHFTVCQWNGTQWN